MSTDSFDDAYRHKNSIDESYEQKLGIHEIFDHRVSFEEPKVEPAKPEVQESYQNQSIKIQSSSHESEARNIKDPESQTIHLSTDSSAKGVYRLGILAVVTLVVSVAFIATAAVKTKSSTFSNHDIVEDLDYEYAAYVVSDVTTTPTVNATDGKGIMTLYRYRGSYNPLSYFTSDASSTLKYSFLDGCVAVVEPHTPMMLDITDYDVASASTYYQYSVCDQATGEDCSTGFLGRDMKTVKVTCSPFDKYTLVATEISIADGTQVRALTGSAMCMYVRRELRDLSSSDLTATMDAMYTLWNTSEEDGQALYGSNFHAIKYFVEAHNFNAAWRDGDHIHEGLGFLTQHIKMSNMFELAMQAVDPSISLPYWDYTIESAAADTVFESFAFTEDTFGTLIPPTNKTIGWTYKDDPLENAAISNGRWAKIKAEYNTEFPDLRANFGYLRAPWNANPSPYVSRFAAYTTSLPTCTHFYKWMTYDTLTDFLNDSPYAPHASTHGAIGAVYGCDIMDDMRAKGVIIDEASQILLCQKWGFMLKELYRRNFISAWSECSYTSFDRDGINCGITCNEDSAHLLNHQLSMVISSKYVGDLDDDQVDEWADFLCNGEASKVFVGDHVESASPDDPSFWPMHPTLDRALQAKYMSGGFTDDSWPSDAVNDYVCDKANCYEDGELDYWDQCCYGHYENDQMLDFVNGDKSAGFGLTNREVLSYSDPTDSGYQMPYIYETFDWDHCEEDFDSLLNPSGDSGDSSVLGTKKITSSTTKDSGKDEVLSSDKSSSSSASSASTSSSSTKKATTSKKSSSTSSGSSARGDSLTEAVDTSYASSDSSFKASEKTGYSSLLTDAWSVLGVGNSNGQ